MPQTSAVDLRDPPPISPGPRWPGLMLAYLGLAVLGQVLLDGDVCGHSLAITANAAGPVGIGFLAAAAIGWLLLEVGRCAGGRPALVAGASAVSGPARWRSIVLAVGVALAVTPAVAPRGGGWAELVAFGADLGRSGNRATVAGAGLWALGVALVLTALARHPRPGAGAMSSESAVRPSELAALAAVTAFAAWLRFRQLAELPPEMISDHAEKLLDVREVLAGLRPVYFAANGGREPLQFYLTAGLVRLGLPLSFLTLKIGMAVVGVLTVPVVWWLGREIGGVRLGLLSALVAAIMPWHLQIVRVGLRAPLSPLFAAATFAVLLSALRSGSRIAWLAVGGLTGGGLYGYTGFRPMLAAAPVAVLAALVIACDRTRWRITLARLAPDLAAAGLVVLLVALPMLRVAVLQPAAFWGRSLARVSNAERAITEPIPRRLVRNWSRTLAMCNMTADGTWALSPPGRPALETVGGGLLVLGLAAAIVGALRRRDWRLAAVLAALPVMLASSAMALAFPGEVPHLARAAGALPLVAVLVALPLEHLLAATSSGGWRRPVRLIVIGLLMLMTAGAAQRVFVEYRATYAERCLPVSRGAAIARRFVGPDGDLGRIVLVGWPDGWDWRAFAFELGDPDWRNVMWGTGAEMRGAVDGVRAHPAGSLCFLGGPFARGDAEILADRHPGATITPHDDPVSRHEFVTVTLPPTASQPTLPQGLRSPPGTGSGS